MSANPWHKLIGSVMAHQEVRDWAEDKIKKETLPPTLSTLFQTALESGVINGDFDWNSFVWAHGDTLTRTVKKHYKLACGIKPDRITQELEIEIFSPSKAKSSTRPDATTAKMMTDMGNAERFSEEYRDSVRYCHGWRRWLVWDGRRWKLDDTGEVDRRAKDTIRKIYRSSAEAMDSDFRKQLAKWAIKSEGVGRRNAMLEMARSEWGIPVVPSQLDLDPWVLNVQNGTIMLATGELYEHSKGDRITKLIDTKYDPKAECPTWYDFLDKIFGRNESLIKFMQLLVGYSLTGCITEQILPILWGAGANGKSTFVGALLDLLGRDYAIRAARDLIMNKSRDSHPTALADLHGKRIAIVSETEEGGRLAESLVKDLTGGEPVRARRMREDYWEFIPTHKTWLVTNHKPNIRGTDYAIWRRIRLIPFSVTIPEEEQDHDLPAKLAAEKEGILAWAVRGCLEWQQAGLGFPDEVKAATEAYKESEDILAAFMSEKCVVNKHAEAKGGELYAEYVRWCNANGEEPKSSRRFGDALTERGFGSRKSNGIWRTGIGIVTDTMQDDGRYEHNTV